MLTTGNLLLEEEAKASMVFVGWLPGRE